MRHHSGSSSVQQTLLWIGWRQCSSGNYKKKHFSNLPVSNHSCNPIITDPRSFINYCSRIDVIHLNLWNSSSCHLSRSVNTVTVERNQWSADFLHLCPEVTAEMCVWTLHVISCMSRSFICVIYSSTWVMFTLYLTISDRWQYNNTTDLWAITENLLYSIMGSA